MLTHTEMSEMRSRHPDWIWNRSDTHVILGVPDSHEAFKTPVEPGNSFSPGVGSYGVSTWAFVGGKLYAPEDLPLNEIEWSFADSKAPILVSKWRAGQVEVQSRLFTDGDSVLSNINDYLTVELRNSGETAVEARFYLVIRSFGAGGGPIRKLAFSNGGLEVNGRVICQASNREAGFGAVSYEKEASDVSVYLRDGKLPKSAAEVEDNSSWASGALEYSCSLQPGEVKRFDFVFQAHGSHHRVQWLPELAPVEIAPVEAELRKHWKGVLGIELNLPDRRFAEAFHAQIMHLAMFTVAGQPRITPISYPLWWLRDGAYVVMALDRAGMHGFAEQAVRDVAHKDAFGGFGSEGDGPSQGLWMIGEHWLLTRSAEFLREMYPHIERKADLLGKMMRTKVPIKKHTDLCTPEMMLAPESDLMCLPSEENWIVGRMDLHFPTYWINGFAWLGLTMAARCAKAMGADGSRFSADADALLHSLRSRVPTLFGKNARDFNSALWPSGWASKYRSEIEQSFEGFWRNERNPDGKYVSEADWTYFEAGQAHNMLLLGWRERAWKGIEHFLTQHTAPGLYTWHEAHGDENSSLQWQRTRGWDRISYVTPHGWTAAEVFLLLRDCLVREHGDTLVIGSGIPADWLDSEFSVTGLPTYFGKVSFQYKNREVVVQIEGIGAKEVRADFGVPVKVKA
jgi:hypothetical protein